MSSAGHIIETSCSAHAGTVPDSTPHLIHHEASSRMQPCAPIVGARQVPIEEGQFHLKCAEPRMYSRSRVKESRHESLVGPALSGSSHPGAAPDPCVGGLLDIAIRTSGCRASRIELENFGRKTSYSSNAAWPGPLTSFESGSNPGCAAQRR